MKTVACIIARTQSTRFPGKVLKEIKGKKLIEYIIEKMKRVKNLESIYVCTSTDNSDRILLEVAEENDIKSYAGSRESPINRMLDVAQIETADSVVRITGDNVFTDEIFLERMIDEYLKDSTMDYMRTEYLPLGVTAEVMKLSALIECYESIDPSESEYLMLYMFNPDKFNCGVLIPEDFLRAEFFSLTVDTPQDFERTKFLIDHLYNDSKIYYDDIIKLSKRVTVPHFKLSKNTSMKMPGGKSVVYGDFRSVILKEKIDKSRKIFLEEGFYENRRSCQSL